MLFKALYSILLVLIWHPSICGEKSEGFWKGVVVWMGQNKVGGSLGRLVVLMELGGSGK